jgi:SAM-dependent methyltransferase
VLLSGLANRGFEVHGFEISRVAIDGADPRARIQIGENLTEAVYPDEYFDEVILWHVLEHLPDPRETLQEIRRIVRPGGRLVVAVPNFSSFQAKWAGAAWFHLDLPRHLFHFPLETLRRLIEECGFVSRSEHHFSLRQNPFGWVQSLLNKNRRLPRNALYRMLKNERFEAPHQERRTKWRQWGAYYLGMPVAICLSFVSAILRNGASVYIVAEARVPAAAKRQP